MANSYHHSPSLLDIIKKQQEERTKATKEVKGRVRVDEIEPLDLKLRSTVLDTPGNSEGTPGDNINGETKPSPFDKLVFTMKQAGQLPEKPAPVVSLLAMFIADLIEFYL